LLGSSSARAMAVAVPSCRAAGGVHAARVAQVEARVTAARLIGAAGDPLGFGEGLGAKLARVKTVGVATQRLKRVGGDGVEVVDPQEHEDRQGDLGEDDDEVGADGGAEGSGGAAAQAEEGQQREQA